MNDVQVIPQFRDLVAEFKENEKRFALAAVNFVKGDLKEIPVLEAAFINTHKVVIEIKEKLAQYDVLQIDDLRLRNDLIAIRENKDFLYFEISEILFKSAGVDRPPFVPEVNQDKWWEILQEEIIPQVDPDGLIQRRMDLGALLVGKTVPEHVRRHLEMIKECYKWGFGNAASIYCRTILEEGFKEALKSKAEFSTPQGKKGLDEMDLSWLIEHSKQKRYFNKEVIDRASLIRMNVNKIVHPSKKEPKVILPNIEIIKDTFYILEMLFR
jgi:hypothetical protein